MRRIRTYSEVAEPAGREVLDQVVAQRRRLTERLKPIRHVVAIASGKGGVGKSAVTANVAAALAGRGLRVGALDADLNGPSLARMLGAAGQRLRVGDDGVEPATGVAGVRVVSMDLLLAGDDAPLRWRGTGEAGDDAVGFLWQSTLETGALREFLADAAWGELDVLLVDVPPGTDKLARLIGLLPAPPTVAIVTTPSEVARFVVARSVRLAREADVSVVGLVANMCAWMCADCGRVSPLYPADGAHRLADSSGIPLWAEIPFDPRLALATDTGNPYVLEGGDAAAARALHALADRILDDAGPGAAHGRPHATHRPEGPARTASSRSLPDAKPAASDPTPRAPEAQ